MSENTRGKFVVVEGGPGSGKSTFVRDFFRQRCPGDDWVIAREPGGSAFGEAVRDAVQGFNNFDISPTASLLGYSASRANLVDTVIDPAILNGQNVMCDRYWFSTLTYQVAEGASVPLCLLTTAVATRRRMMPDLVLFFDVDIETGQRRKGENEDTDKFDVRDKEFFETVFANYRIMGKILAPRWEIIDASKSKIEVAQQCFDVLERRKII